MYTDNALLFPEEAIPVLEDKRGYRWQELVQRVRELPEQHEERLAFMLFMMRLNGCMDCETDCYRAMRGCVACSLQSLRRYKGSDDELLAGFARALADIREYALENALQNAGDSFSLLFPPTQHSLPLMPARIPAPAFGEVALASIP